MSNPACLVAWVNGLGNVTGYGVYSERCPTSFSAVRPELLAEVTDRGSYVENVRELRARVRRNGTLSHLAYDTKLWTALDAPSAEPVAATTK